MIGRGRSNISRSAAETADADTRRTESGLPSALLPGFERQLEKLLAAALTPGLYLVSTPIGNLADISIRAVSILARADVVVCEDTRHSRTLLSAYGIKRQVEAYHDFSGAKDRARILKHLAGNKSVALISDAGTPLIADPGYKLVRSAIDDGFCVFTVPGPSAAIAALVSSGLPTDRFLFCGFLPPKEGQRRSLLERFLGFQETLVFYETASRLPRTLSAVAEIFPKRLVVVARELTKLHEETLRGTALELLEKIRTSPPQGEIVLLFGPGMIEAPSESDILAALEPALKKASLRDAVEEVAERLGVARKLVYNLALKIGGE